MSELDAYLKVTGLDNYELTEEEMMLLNESPKLSNFRLGNLFRISPTKNYGLTNDVLFESKGQIPVVVNSSKNNGIGGRVCLKAKEKANTITFSDTTSAESIFVQDEDFIGYSHVQALYPLNDREYSTLELLYIATLFRKVAIQNGFNYAYKFNRDLASDFLISLPVNKNNDIDYKRMQSYIFAIEKLVIKDLVDWKNQVIKTTKEYVNNNS